MDRIGEPTWKGLRIANCLTELHDTGFKEEGILGNLEEFDRIRSGTQNRP
jgi:hypothetical protein